MEFGKPASTNTAAPVDFGKSATEQAQLPHWQLFCNVACGCCHLFKRGALLAHDLKSSHVRDPFNDLIKRPKEKLHYESLNRLRKAIGNFDSDSVGEQDCVWNRQIGFREDFIHPAQITKTGFGASDSREKWFGVRIKRLTVPNP